MTAMNLYSARVGNVGSFFVAAVDISQAKALAEQWRDTRPYSDRIAHQNVSVKRHSDPRPVYAPGV
jgi:hypothetical protein